VAYRISVQNPIDRARDLKAAAGAEGAEHLPYYNFRDELTRLPLARVSIDLPIYRMANFRTQRQQLHFARSHGYDENYFEVGEEDEAVQQVQHDFLWALAQEGQGESVVAVSTVLEQEGQKLPLLVTANGVVVNGNRRLAAMRELLAQVKDFEFVQVAVLPEYANESDLIRIEVREQMQRETKLPYGWVNDALAIRKMQAKSFTKTWIKDEMHLSSLSDVDDKVGALEAAETYLAERNEVDNWDKVDGQEQLFKDGYKALKNRNTNAGQREAVRAVLHVIADKPREFGKRSYEYMAPFKDNAPRLLTMLAAQLGIDGPRDDEELPNESLLVPISVAGAAPELMTTLKEVLNEGDGDKVRAHIKQAVEAYKDEKNAKQAGEQALAHARKANAEVSLIDLSGARKDTIPDLSEQLGLISRRCERLLEQLKSGSAT
jgi:hypothetical protein